MEIIYELWGFVKCANNDAYLDTVSLQEKATGHPKPASAAALSGRPRTTDAVNRAARWSTQPSPLLLAAKLFKLI